MKEVFHCPYCNSDDTHINNIAIYATSATRSGFGFDVDQVCNDCGRSFTDFFNGEYIGCYEAEENKEANKNVESVC